MQCPLCKEEIAYVNVVSTCWQKGILIGNKITNYESVEEIGDTEEFRCPECDGEITRHIEG